MSVQRDVKLKSLFVLFCAAALITGCDQSSPDNRESINKDPFPSQYQPLPRKQTLIRNATILTGRGERLDDMDLLMAQGKIVRIGSNLSVEGAKIIDASGKWLTPGVIDVHSHLGVYPSPVASAHDDGNEKSDPNTAEVWAEHSVWPQDPGFHAAQAGGVTTLQILPGSSNLFGGRGVTLKNVPAAFTQAMKFPGAPYGLKMACGSNPKSVYGRRNQLPYTRMGNMAGYRTAWSRAVEYKRGWEQYEAGQRSEPPQRDLALDTLRGVLDGEILVHNHCYKAEEIAMMIDLGKEFSYHSGTMHHATEAYKIADLLVENDNCVAMWSDWWGAKMESYDAIYENLALVNAVEGACVIVHSDSKYTIQRLNQEAGKILYRANENGFQITAAEAIQWITFNAAKSLGIADKTGSLEPGKAADLVIWSQNPFSVYARADQVFIDGAKVYDRFDPKYQARSDFMVGQQHEGIR